MCGISLQLSVVVWAKRQLISLLIQHNYWLWLILSSCFSDGAEGCWFPFSSVKNDWCTLARERCSRPRERSLIWLSLSINTRGEAQKGPRWAGKWTTLTSSNLRKHLLLLIKIEWKKVISVQSWPSQLKLIKQPSLDCSLCSSQEKSQDGKGAVWYSC